MPAQQAVVQTLKLFAYARPIEITFYLSLQPAPGGVAELEASLQAQIDQVDALAKLLGMKKK